MSSSLSASLLWSRNQNHSPRWSNGCNQLNEDLLQTPKHSTLSSLNARLTYPTVKMLTLTPNIVLQIHDDHVLPLLLTNPRGRFHCPWTSSNVIRVIITLSSPPKNKQ